MANAHLQKTLAKAQTSLESAIQFRLRKLSPQDFKEETEAENEHRSRKKKATETAFKLRQLELRLEDLAVFKQEAEKRVKAVQDAIDAAAYDARDAGLSWARIGKALGMSSQGAHQRYDPDAGQRHRRKFVKSLQGTGLSLKS